MANQKTKKVLVNKQRFMEVLKLRNCSIRKLGDAYDEIQRTEKTIRRCLDEGAMPPDLLDNIAKYLDVHPNYLSGVYDLKADRIEDSYLRFLFRSSIKPEKYPYLLKARSDIDYNSYFQNILTMNNITMEQFGTLDPMERIMFRQEMVFAILQVIAKHFSHDSLGNDMEDELSYCEAFVNDFDPFSYFAELEGIGLSENDVELPFDDGDCSELESRLLKKYVKE
jgi:hypothetical protein